MWLKKRSFLLLFIHTGRVYRITLARFARARRFRCWLFGCDNWCRGQRGHCTINVSEDAKITGPSTLERESGQWIQWEILQLFLKNALEKQSIKCTISIYNKKTYVDSANQAQGNTWTVRTSGHWVFLTWSRCLHEVFTHNGSRTIKQKNIQDKKKEPCVYLQS